jgi:hypothetical protein
VSWKPLLVGALADAAWDSVLAIAEALEDTTSEIQDSSYANGHAGLALFHGYLAAARDDERFADLAEAHLREAIDGLFHQAPPAGFFLGPTGVAWTNQHLEELLTGGAATNVNEELDEWIADTVRSTPWRGDYDLVFGLAGLACYALDHPDGEFGAAVIASVVDRLDELAEWNDTGITWWTPPLRLFSPVREEYPEGYYNLGAAHGVAGVVGILGRACGAGLGRGLARRLLDGGVAWVLANKRADDGGSTFPSFLAPQPVGATASCRSAWCYGDPGMVAALLTAARAVGQPEWEREALAIARRDCAR